MMHLFAAVLLAFTGWTLATHIAATFGLSLNALMLYAPGLICALFLLYIVLVKRSSLNQIAAHATPEAKKGPGENPQDRCKLRVLALVACTVLLLISWYAFWLAALACTAFSLRRAPASEEADIRAPRSFTSHRESLFVLTMSLIAALLSLWVSRPDLDDAFYVAIAASANANPNAAILSSDPMHGAAGLPLILPSYRFSSFEILGAAVAATFGLTAVEAMHLVMPPFWAAFTVMSVFLLCSHIDHKRRFIICSLTLFLMVLLGECHRGYGNFGFVRIFQGKAVYVSAVVPAVYLLTWRSSSRRGTAADSFLLVCVQLTAVGMSNFAALAAPMAGLTAWITAWVEHGTWRPSRRLLVTFAALTAPVPYLFAVALAMPASGHIRDSAVESAASVWLSVFGEKQQYLVALLLMAGPLLARSRTERVRLAVPIITLLGAYLNPLTSSFLSESITTPQVYWRVAWAVPLPVLCASGLSFIASKASGTVRRRSYLIMLGATLTATMVIAVPYHVLRSDNRVEWQFGKVKVSTSDLTVARRAVALCPRDRSIAAPDQIAGVISMFENHPPLASVRTHYLELLKDSFGSEQYEDRMLLHRTTLGEPANTDLLRAALQRQHVGVVVMPQHVDSGSARSTFESAGLTRREILHGYIFWTH